MNTVILSGRVGADPEMKYFESGKARTRLSLGVNRWSQKDKKEVADWFNIDLWEKNAEIAGEYVRKGKMIEIEGKMKIDRWKDETGEHKERHYINASSIKLLGGKKDE